MIKVVLIPQCMIIKMFNLQVHLFGVLLLIMLQKHSLSNEIKDDVTDKNHKYNLYKQFVTWACKSCYVAPLTDYANNNIFQELPTEEDYFTNSDKRLYLDFRKNNGYTNELE